MTERKPRRHILLPADLFPEIDEYRFNNRIETRTEAIERLIRAGLAATADSSASTRKRRASQEYNSKRTMGETR